MALTPDRLRALLRQAATLMAAGRYAEALASYEALLASQPQLASALSGSAAALRELGRPHEALARARAALAVQPSVEAHFQCASAWRDLGRFGEAVASFDQALALRPDLVEAHNNRGIALLELHRPAEALASFERALALKPESAELHNNRGNILRRLQRLPEALASFDQALALQPNLAQAHNNRGMVLQAMRRYREAEASYRRAIELQPGLAEAHNNLGTALCQLGQPRAALASCQRALELQPGMLGVHANLGSALRDLERPAEALAHYDQALRQEPQHADYHCLRGNALFDLARIDDAMASYRRALELDPAHALAHFNMSLCLLLSGDLPRGLPLYEWRKRLRSGSAATAGPARTAAAWLGEQDITGKSLLLYADQALGDTIQFCRYAPLAEARGARVTLSVPAQLRELLAGLSPTLNFVASGTEQDRFDYQCALGSLPLAFGTSLASIPARVPYLAADARRTGAWRERLGAHGFRIGIAWQGSRNRIDTGRSLPLAMFAPLAALPGVRLISLQKGAGLEQLPQASPALELLGEDFDAGPQAFLDSAAVMMHLDLIISGDTALAHLAGALGRPTWLALKQVPDSRWLLGRADSPWYPSVRLFRQPQRGDWASVFAAIQAELARLVAR